MKQYSAHLDESQVRILSSCIGKQIQFVNAPGADVSINSNYIRSYYNFSVAIDTYFFLVFKNVWVETQLYTDYWKLNVEENKSPEGIDYDIQRRCYIGPHFSFHLPRALEILKIEIYQKTEATEEELINYDYAVLLHLEDNIQLAFFPMESIADGIEFNTNIEQIEKAINDCSRRLELSK